MCGFAELISGSEFFRSLLYRPLPLDIGRCTCVIVKEKSPEGLDGGALFSLYTNVTSLKLVLKKKLVFFLFFLFY